MDRSDRRDVFSYDGVTTSIERGESGDLGFAVTVSGDQGPKHYWAHIRVDGERLPDSVLLDISRWKIGDPSLQIADAVKIEALVRSISANVSRIFARQKLALAPGADSNVKRITFEATNITEDPGQNVRDVSALFIKHIGTCSTSGSESDGATVLDHDDSTDVKDASKQLYGLLKRSMRMGISGAFSDVDSNDDDSDPGEGPSGELSGLMDVMEQPGETDNPWDNVADRIPSPPQNLTEGQPKLVRTRSMDSLGSFVAYLDKLPTPRRSHLVDPESGLTMPVLSDEDKEALSALPGMAKSLEEKAQADHAAFDKVHDRFKILEEMMNDFFGKAGNKDELDALQEQVRSLENKISELVSNDGDKDELNALRDELKQSKDMITDLINQVGNKDDLNELQGHVKGLESKISDLIDKSGDKEGLEALQGQVRGLEEKIEGFVDLLGNKEELGSLQSQVKSLEDKISDFVGEAGTKEELAALEDQVKSLEAKLDTFLGKVDEDRDADRFKDLESKLDQLATKDADKDVGEVISGLSDRLAQLSDTIEEQAASTVLPERVDGLEAKLDKLVVKLEEIANQDFLAPLLEKIALGEITALVPRPGEDSTIDAVSGLAAQRLPVAAPPGAQVVQLEEVRGKELVATKRAVVDSESIGVGTDSAPSLSRTRSEGVTEEVQTEAPLDVSTSTGVFGTTNEIAVKDAMLTLKSLVKSDKPGAWESKSDELPDWNNIFPHAMRCLGGNETNLMRQEVSHVLEALRGVCSTVLDSNGCEAKKLPTSVSAAAYAIGGGRKWDPRIAENVATMDSARSVCISLAKRDPDEIVNILKQAIVDEEEGTASEAVSVILNICCELLDAPNTDNAIFNSQAQVSGSAGTVGFFKIHPFAGKDEISIEYGDFNADKAKKGSGALKESEYNVQKSARKEALGNFLKSALLDHKTWSSVARMLPESMVSLDKPEACLSEALRQQIEAAVQSSKKVLIGVTRDNKKQIELQTACAELFGLAISEVSDLDPGEMFEITHMMDKLSAGDASAALLGLVASMSEGDQLLLEKCIFMYKALGTYDPTNPFCEYPDCEAFLTWCKNRFVDQHLGVDDVHLASSRGDISATGPLSQMVPVLPSLLFYDSLTRATEFKGALPTEGQFGWVGEVVLCNGGAGKIPGGEIYARFGQGKSSAVKLAQAYLSRHCPNLLADQAFYISPHAEQVDGFRCIQVKERGKDIIVPVSSPEDLNKPTFVVLDEADLFGAGVKIFLKHGEQRQLVSTVLSVSATPLSKVTTGLSLQMKAQEGFLQSTKTLTQEVSKHLSSIASAKEKAAKEARQSSIDTLKSIYMPALYTVVSSKVAGGHEPVSLVGNLKVSSERMKEDLATAVKHSSLLEGNPEVKIKRALLLASIMTNATRPKTKTGEAMDVRKSIIPQRDKMKEALVCFAVNSILGGKKTISAVEKEYLSNVGLSSGKTITSLVTTDMGHLDIGDVPDSPSTIFEKVMKEVCSEVRRRIEQVDVRAQQVRVDIIQKHGLEAKENVLQMSKKVEDIWKSKHVQLAEGASRAVASIRIKEKYHKSRLDALKCVQGPSSTMDVPKGDPLSDCQGWASYIASSISASNGWGGKSQIFFSGNRIDSVANEFETLLTLVAKDSKTEDIVFLYMDTDGKRVGIHSKKGEEVKTSRKRKYSDVDIPDGATVVMLYDTASVQGCHFVPISTTKPGSEIVQHWMFPQSVTSLPLNVLLQGIGRTTGGLPTSVHFAGDVDHRTLIQSALESQGILEEKNISANAAMSMLKHLLKAVHAYKSGSGASVEIKKMELKDVSIASLAKRLGVNQIALHNELEKAFMQMTGGATSVESLIEALGKTQVAEMLTDVVNNSTEVAGAYVNGFLVPLMLAEVNAAVALIGQEKDRLGELQTKVA